MLKIYNSLTGRKENLDIQAKKKINIYVCGPTVYDHLHIGNIRPLIFFDFMKKYLLNLGYDVCLVMNITDLDDKIIQAALKQKITESQIADQYINAFFALLAQLDIKTIDQFPRVTDYIPHIISYIAKLEQKGYTYTTNKGIYFKVNLIEKYGILSHQDLLKLKKNIRKELDPQKYQIEDFILWKKTDVGIRYESPWFLGRPGWHTECAVMVKQIFGLYLDIHGGGHDLKFPHHENEQAQFLASEQKSLAKFFMHVGNINYYKQKMSKSLGNVILAKDLIERFSSNVVKFFFLSYHYTQPINYTEQLIQDVNTKYNKILGIVKKNAFQLFFYQIATPNSLLDSYIQKFHLFMQNDFNTPNVITLIESLCKNMHKCNDLIYLNQLQNTLLYLLEYLGIIIKLAPFNSQQMINYQLWKDACTQKDFRKADFLRNILIQEGIL